MVGAPGCGKSMIAKRMPTILPQMTEEEVLETTSIYSICGLLKDSGLITNRPFRSPHYNASSNALIGGGMNAMPGEISLSHNGILFLDELPQFSRNTLEALKSVPLRPSWNRQLQLFTLWDKTVYSANFRTNTWTNWPQNDNLIWSEAQKMDSLECQRQKQSSGILISPLLGGQDEFCPRFVFKRNLLARDSLIGFSGSFMGDGEVCEMDRSLRKSRD